MYNYQKIATAVISSLSKGQNVSYSEIIKVVLVEFPKMKKGSILPSDYCEDHISEDPWTGKYVIFKKDKINKGRYIVLSHNKIKKSCKLNNKII
jgi:hypothetical protein